MLLFEDKNVMVLILFGFRAKSADFREAVNIRAWAFFTFSLLGDPQRVPQDRRQSNEH